MHCARRNVLFAVFLCLILGLAIEAAPPGKEICDNGISDDRDDLIDCADPDCKKDPACQVPADPSGECNLSFMAVLSDVDGDGILQSVTSDGLKTDCGSSGEYCSGEDKVTVKSLGDGFAFITQDTSPRKKDTPRTAVLDLSIFQNLGDCSGGPCEPRWWHDCPGAPNCIPIHVNFSTPPGRLNLCSLCVPGS